MGGIRIWLRPGAKAALIAVLAGVLVAASVPQPARAGCTPLPPVITCPAPAPTQGPADPVVTVTAPTGVGTRTATLNGTINPEGAATTYHWVYADASGEYLGDATATETLPAGYSPQPISTPIAGLRPGVPYTVSLYASNSQGQVMAEQPSAFTTAAHPILTVTVSDTSIAIGQAFQVFVTRKGAYDPLGAVYVYIAKSPYRHWVNVGEATLATRGRLAVYPCPASYQYDGGCPWLDRNFKVRAQMGASHSPSRLVYVYPSFTLTTTREDYNDSPYLDLTFSALVHETKGRYPDPPVYFYDSPHRNGPFTRVGVHRFRHQRAYDSEELIARDRIDHPGAVYTIACVSRPLFEDMGRRFLDPKCGLPRVG